MKRLLAILALAATPAAGQSCFPYDQHVANKERTVAEGSGYIIAEMYNLEHGTMMEIMVDPETGRWLVFVTYPADEATCIIATGHAYEMPLPQPAAGVQG